MRADGAYRYHDTETCLAQDPIIQGKYGGHLEVLRVNHHAPVIVPIKPCWMPSAR